MPIVVLCTIGSVSTQFQVSLPHFLFSQLFCFHLSCFMICLTGVSVLAWVSASFTMLLCDHLRLISILNVFKLAILVFRFPVPLVPTLV